MMQGPSCQFLRFSVSLLFGLHSDVLKTFKRNPPANRSERWRQIAFCLPTLTSVGTLILELIGGVLTCGFLRKHLEVGPSHFGMVECVSDCTYGGPSSAQCKTAAGKKRQRRSKPPTLFQLCIFHFTLLFSFVPFRPQNLFFCVKNPTAIFLLSALHGPIPCLHARHTQHFHIAKLASG